MMATKKGGLLAEMLAEARGGDWTAALAALDWLRENGHGAMADCPAWQPPVWIAPAARARSVADHVKQYLQALELHVALAKVDADRVPVVCTDRRIPRKEQAALARKLFRSLGLPHVSVTAPNYSMASTVDVTLPRRSDYTAFDEIGCVLRREDPAALANAGAERKVEAILAVAFPTHDDRSDSSSDYFDARWSIH